MHSNSVFSLFTIVIRPTDKGVTNLDEIFEAVFSFIRLYLPMLKQNGLLQQLYRDFMNAESWPQHISDGLLHSVQSLAKSLLVDSSRTELENKYDEINDAIDTLNKGNFNITITVPSTYDESIQFDLKEESSNAEYSERKMPDKWILLWNNPKVIDEFSLPAQNPYIADDFTILYDESQSVPKYPAKVYESDVSELWFRQDDTFLYPVTCCNFHFKTPNALSSIKK